MAVYTTIDDPSAYFNTKLYTGSGSAQTVTGVGFNSDFTWIKSRNNTHANTVFAKPLNDGLNHLYSNTNDAAGTGKMNSYNSDGYVLPNNNETNNNGNNYVSWNWLANGAGSSNTDGSINTTKTSANTTSGFSISTYTGTGIGSGTATVGHGLGSIPSLVIQKRTGGAANWGMYHKSIGNTGSIALNSDAATNTQTDYWGDTTPTSALVTVGPNFAISGGNILFSFIEKQGFSKFGSYTGNGNANGPFIYTGFKPAFVMVKNTATTSGWYRYDNKRGVYNPNGTVLFADAATAEITNTASGEHPIDFLSNGFKIRTTSSARNGSGNKIIFIAFAEAPFVNSNGVPTTAR